MIDVNLYKHAKSLTTADIVTSKAVTLVCKLNVQFFLLGCLRLGIK